MPVEKRTAQTNRVATPRRPFHLRLPDVFAVEKSRATPALELRQPRQTVALDSTTRARSQLANPQSRTAEFNSGPSKIAPSTSTRSAGILPLDPDVSQKRYQDGQQQVTGMIERMRVKRRKLFDRLWVASIVVTALSVVALAVELIQGIQSPVPTRVANTTVRKAEPRSRFAQKPAASPSRPVSGARSAGNEMQDDQPVTSALYTTEDGPRPNGIWLGGPNTDSDSEPDRPSRGGQHDSHQSRAR